MKKAIRSTKAAVLFLFPIICYGLLSPMDMGRMSYVLGKGAAGSRAKPIANNYYESRGAGGQVVSNVNLLTGQPSYQVPLVTLNVDNKFSYPIGISYSGPISPILNNDNKRAPSGILGMGWSFSTPYVAINHKGTVTYTDDVVFCNLGPFGGGQILQSETDQFYVSTDPTIKVTVEWSWGPLRGQIESWTFTLSNGIKLKFGVRDYTISPSERTIKKNFGLLRATPYTMGTDYIYKWDIVKITEPSGGNSLVFDYAKIPGPLFLPGQTYTRESYVSSIIWRNEFGNEVQKAVFGYESLSEAEIAEIKYSDLAAPSDQRLFETFRLKTIHVFHEEKFTMQYTFKSEEILGLPQGIKRKLTGIDINYHPDPELKKTDGWKFDYDGAKEYLLTNITAPSKNVQEFDYSLGSFYRTIGGQDFQKKDFTYNYSGVPIIVPRDEDKVKENWQNVSTCDERFCYEMLSVKDFGDSCAREFVRITHNTGNYFDSHPASAFTLGEDYCEEEANQFQVIPLGEYYLAIGKRYGSVDIWQWNGDRFLQIDDEVDGEGPSDPIRKNENFGGEINVYATGNYFIVNRLSNGYKTWVYFLNHGTGKWTSLTHGHYQQPTCRIRNNGEYPESIRPDGNTECLTWKDKPARVFTSKNMFMLVHDPTDIIFTYTFNSDGSGFYEVLHPHWPDVTLYPDLQHPTFKNNWERDIRSIKAANDYFLIESSKESGGQTYTRMDVFNFDGENIHYLKTLKDNSGNHWLIDDDPDDGDGKKDRYVYLHDSYLVQVSLETDKNVVLYDKFYNSGSSKIDFHRRIVYNRPGTNGKDCDIQVNLSSNFFTVEYYPNLAFYKSPRGRFTPLADPEKSDDYDSHLFKYTPGLAPEKVPDAKYSASKGSCPPKRAYNLSFSFVGKVMTGIYSEVHGTGGPCPGICAEDSELSCTFDNFRYAIENGYPGNPTAVPNIEPLNAYFKNLAWSQSGTLIQNMVIDHGLGLVQSRRLFYSGPNFFTHPKSYVVSGFKSYSGLGNSHKEVLFVYPGFVNTIFPYEWNNKTQSPRFSAVFLEESGVDGEVWYQFQVDNFRAKLKAEKAGLKGRLFRKIIKDKSHQTLNVTNYTYNDGYNFQGVWPKYLWLNRLEAISSKNSAPGTSSSAFQSTTTQFYQYNDYNNHPQFSSIKFGDAAWRITQSQFTAINHLPKQEIIYAAPYDESEPSGPFNLKTARVDVPLPVNPIDGEYIIQSDKRIYDPGTFNIKSTYIWRDFDDGLSDNDLKEPVTPVYDVNRNFDQLSEVLWWNHYDEPTSTIIYKTDTEGSYKSVFYEGRASLPVGTINNSKIENCAILTAENGNVTGLATLDQPSYWFWHMNSGAGAETRWLNDGATYNSLQVYSGAGSFFVDDKFGPFLDLYLIDVRVKQFGYIASAWVYVKSGVPLVYVTTRRYTQGNWNGTIVGTFIASPANGESPVLGKWQRYEVFIPYSDLISGDLFNGNNDFIRFTAGAPIIPDSPYTGGEVYIDDIVCRPSNSSFSLAAYNNKLQITSATNSNHQKTSYEYSDTGAQTGIRDDENRIFSQSGYNKIGEN